MDQHPAVGQLFGVIALGPDPGELAEVRRAQLFPGGVIPQADRHGREMPGADQLAFLPDDSDPRIVPDLDGHAQALALDFPATNRQQRVAVNKARNDVGSAGHRRQAQVALEVAVNIVVALGRQRGTGAQQGFQTAQVMALPRLHAVAFQGRQVLGAGAEDADAFIVDQIDQTLRLGMKG
ncbi:hypothetical protein D3C84_860750 [compost metagenome]